MCAIPRSTAIPPEPRIRDDGANRQGLYRLSATRFKLET
jgi:hypothetical protein